MRTQALVVFLVVVTATAVLAAPEKDLTVRSIDLDRIEELYRLTDRFGEALWPGFDARQVPLGINHENRLELLIAHPEPPDAFRVVPDRDLKGVPVLVRQGTDRLGPGTGGTAADLYGIYSVYMNTLQPGSSTENYLSILLHECFHVYQRKFREPISTRRSAYPEHDPAYSARVGLEGRVLHAALHAPDDEEARELTRMFLAVRRERRKGLDEDVVRAEGDGEYDEGTATYVQVRLFDLLGETEDFAPGLANDSQYDGFRGAATDRERLVARLLPSGRTAIRFHLAKYGTGMAQCLLLDRFRPGWKEEMREKGSTMTALLQRTLPLGDADVGNLAASAKARFGHAALLAQQTTIMEKHLARIRGFLSGEGRRYRIRTGILRGTPRSRMRGPVYRVPPELLERSGPVTIYAQGAWYQRDGLTLDMKRVPVIVHPGFLEWIDRDPAPDGSDLQIEYERREGGAYESLVVTTDGFVLTVDRARITQTDDLVTIRPVRRRKR